MYKWTYTLKVRFEWLRIENILDTCLNGGTTCAELDRSISVHYSQ